MARGQVTDEELSSGLKSLGGFSTLTTARPLRDSPFRDSRNEVKLVEVTRVSETAPVALPSEVSSAKSLDGEAVAPIEAEGRKQQEGKLARGRAPVPEKKSVTEERPEKFTERVTLQMNAKMRSELDSLARELHRARKTKGERITTNTIMRVAIRQFLDEFRLQKGREPNSEAELLALIKRKAVSG